MIGKRSKGYFIEFEESIIKSINQSQCKSNYRMTLLESTASWVGFFLGGEGGVDGKLHRLSIFLCVIQKCLLFQGFIMFNLQVQCQYYMPDNFDLLNTFLPLSLGVPCQGLLCNVWLAFPSGCPIQLYLYVLMVTSSGCCLVLFHKSSICCLYGIEPPHFNISVSQRPWLRSRMMTFLYTGFSSYRETFLCWCWM